MDRRSVESLTVVVKGTKPPADEAGKQEYLRQKLEEARKNCLWLAGAGGGAELLGALLKAGVGSTAPTALRLAVFGTAGVQVLLALVGGFSWNSGEIDNARITAVLTRRFNTRRWLRNFSAALLIITFVLIVVLALNYPVPPSND